jgi:hypothetical protein
MIYDAEIRGDGGSASVAFEVEEFSAGTETI